MIHLIYIKMNAWGSFGGRISSDTGVMAGVYMDDVTYNWKLAGSRPIWIINRIEIKTE